MDETSWKRILASRHINYTPRTFFRRIRPCKNLYSLRSPLSFPYPRDFAPKPESRYFGSTRPCSRSQCFIYKLRIRGVRRAKSKWNLESREDRPRISQSKLGSSIDADDRSRVNRGEKYGVANALIRRVFSRDPSAIVRFLRSSSSSSRWRVGSFLREKGTRSAVRKDSDNYFRLSASARRSRLRNNRISRS